MGFESVEKRKCFSLLIEIAKVQKCLLQNHFDWKTRTIIISDKQRGFFHRKAKSVREYEMLLDSLEKLKNQLRAVYKTAGHGKIFWWDLSWEQVEPYMIHNLAEETALGKWRYEYHWEAIGDESEKVLILREEGHFSDFSSNAYEYKRNESAYSDVQQLKMVEDYNKKLDKQKRREIWADDGRLVRTDIGSVYASVKDYYDSWEYKTERQIANQLYARSLYTKRTTNIKTVVSNSRHYECVFEAGAFHFDEDKVLDGLIWHPLELKAGRGNMPEGLDEKYKDRDAAVVCAAFISDQRWIPCVSFELFGKRFMGDANSLAEAVQSSQLFTCLSDKLADMLF